MIEVVLAVALAAPLVALTALPLVYARLLAWPSEPPDEIDDVARTVSSLRDLEFARVAGTIASQDYDRLRDALEREGLARRSMPAPARTPVMTLAIAGLAVGVVAVVIAASLPRDLGERDVSGVVTGSGGRALTPTATELEAQLGPDRRDIPTLLALASAYEQEDRLKDAVAVYQEVLALDKDNVSALDALGAILVQNDAPDAALMAVERVLTLRPRDSDALAVKGAALYLKARYAEAVDAWRTFLEVATYDPRADAVRSLIDEASVRMTRP